MSVRLRNLACFVLLIAAFVGGIVLARYCFRPALNAADARTIAAYVYDIGPVRAQAIVDERARGGPFTSWHDFQVRMRSHDIGPVVVANARAGMRLGSP